MFGYIRPFQPELKVKEDNKYKAYYCGLCKTLGQQYSLASRMSLSYDASFLYFFLSSLISAKEEPYSKRCVFHPQKKKLFIINEAADYAAGINILLTYYKLADDRVDNGNPLYSVLKWGYSGVFRHAAQHYPKAEASLTKHLENLHALERQREKSVDLPANEFASLLAELFALAPFEQISQNQRDHLHGFGYNLGRFLYLLDAYDDLAEDIKKGRYNPFALQYGYRSGISVQEFRKSFREEASFNLYFSLAEAVRHYEQLGIEKNTDMIDNILYLGLKYTTSQILEEQNGSI